MGKRYFGKIVTLYKNYGLIETVISDHKVKLYFNVLPSMLDSKGNLSLREHVSFETRKMIWHDIGIVCAYNIKEESGQNISPHSSRIKETDFSRFLFASMRFKSVPGKNTIDKLIDTERRVNLFYLKWILYVEKITKISISRAVESIGKTSSWLIDKLGSNRATKEIIKNALNGIKDKTWLSSISEYVNYSPNKSDPNDIIVSDAPIELLLSSVTLGELSDILKTIFSDFSLIETKDSDLFIYLWYAEGMLSDLSVIRNAAAHGNAINPLIVDNTFSPAYFYEMADVFPQWNSNDSLNNAEKYKAFTFIRFLAKSEAKIGVHLTGLPIYSPQIEALFFTKTLFLNPARKSLFSLFFLLHSIFTFVDSSQMNIFYKDLHDSGLSFFDDDAESPFSGFPYKNDSISSRLLSVVWVIIRYGDIRNFRCFATNCKKS